MWTDGTAAAPLPAPPEQLLADTLAVFGRSNATLDPDLRLRRLLESAMRIVGATRGSVLVAHREGALRAAVTLDLTSHASCGARGESPRGEQAGVGEKYAGAALRVPLRVRSRTVGVLELLRCGPSTDSTHIDLATVEALAQHLALVLAAARLTRRIRMLLERLLAAASARAAGRSSELRRPSASPCRLPPPGASVGAVR